MLSLVNAHANFLSSAQSVAPSSVSFAEQCGKHKDQLRKSLQAIPKNKVCLKDAADALDAIKVSCFSEQDKTDLVTTITAIVSNVEHSGSIAPVGRRAALEQQEHLYMHRYMTEADWVALRSSTCSIDSKIDVVVARSKAIGLLSLTERTAKALSALVIVAHGQACNTNSCYDTTQKLKDGFRKMRKFRCASTQPTCAEFPDVAATFLAAWPDKYEAGHGPIECPIDQSAITTLTNSMPCRRTHMSLRDQPFLMTAPPIRRSSSMSSDVTSLQHILVPLAQALATQGQQGLKRSHDLTFGAGSPSGGIALTPSGDDARLALPPTEVARPPAPKGPLAIQDETPAEATEGAVENGSASQAKAALADEHKAGVSTKSMSEAIMEMQATIAAKAAKAKEEKEATEDTPDGKGKAKAKASPKAKGKGKGKAKASPKASPKGSPKASPKAKLATTVASSKSDPKPRMPPLRKVDPVRYKTCTVYCDVKKRQWRAIEKSNPRRDVKFSWKDGQASWDKCLKWCDDNAK